MSGLLSPRCGVGTASSPFYRWGSRCTLVPGDSANGAGSRAWDQVSSPSRASTRCVTLGASHGPSRSSYFPFCRAQTGVPACQNGCEEAVRSCLAHSRCSVNSSLSIWKRKACLHACHLHLLGITSIQRLCQVAGMGLGTRQPEISAGSSHY